MPLAADEFLPSTAGLLPTAVVSPAPDHNFRSVHYLHELVPCLIEEGILRGKRRDKYESTGRVDVLSNPLLISLGKEWSMFSSASEFWRVHKTRADLIAALHAEMVRRHEREEAERYQERYTRQMKAAYRMSDEERRVLRRKSVQRVRGLLRPYKGDQFGQRGDYIEGMLYASRRHSLKEAVPPALQVHRRGLPKQPGMIGVVASLREPQSDSEVEESPELSKVLTVAEANARAMASQRNDGSIEEDITLEDFIKRNEELMLPERVGGPVRRVPVSPIVVERDSDRYEPDAVQDVEEQLQQQQRSKEDVLPTIADKASAQQKSARFAHVQSRYLAPTKAHVARMETIARQTGRKPQRRLRRRSPRRPEWNADTHLDESQKSVMYNAGFPGFLSPVSLPRLRPKLVPVAAAEVTEEEVIAEAQPEGDAGGNPGSTGGASQEGGDGAAAPAGIAASANATVTMRSLAPLHDPRPWRKGKIKRARKAPRKKVRATVVSKKRLLASKAPTAATESGEQEALNPLELETAGVASAEADAIKDSVDTRDAKATRSATAAAPEVVANAAGVGNDDSDGARDSS